MRIDFLLFFRFLPLSCINHILHQHINLRSKSTLVSTMTKSAEDMDESVISGLREQILGKRSSRVIHMDGRY